MGRTCSQCGSMGHNSRTCSATRRSIRLFGVQLDPASAMKKSFSMDRCLSSSSSSSLASSSAISSSSPSRTTMHDNSEKLPTGYVPYGLLKRTQERKKGVPWSEEEHRSFLVGLESLGRGDWRGIACNYVTTRTPTQVASHAQKYFLRLNRLDKRKRRPSLFDVRSQVGRNKPTVQALDDGVYPQRGSAERFGIPSDITNASQLVHRTPPGSRERGHPLDYSKPIWLDTAFNYGPPPASACPDLELKLSAPTTPLEESEPCSGSILRGPISVK